MNGSSESGFLFKVQSAAGPVTQTTLFRQNGGVNISSLRLETAYDHASVEELMPLMDAELRFETYVRVLLQFQPFVAAWESCLLSHPDRPSDEFIADRNRLPLIVQDLAILSAGNFRTRKCQLPKFEGRARLMGAMYVVEGSRLGGQIIARHVENILAFSPGHGTRYFRGFGDRTGPMWRQLLGLMSLGFTDEETSEVIVGAKQMFSAFRDWMAQEQG